MSKEETSGLLQVKIVGNKDVILKVDATPTKVEVKINSKIIGQTDVPMIIGHDDVAILTIHPASEGPLKISINAKPKE